MFEHRYFHRVERTRTSRKIYITTSENWRKWYRATLRSRIVVFISLFQAPGGTREGEGEGMKTAPPRFRPLTLFFARLFWSLEQAKFSLTYINCGSVMFTNLRTHIKNWAWTRTRFRKVLFIQISAILVWVLIRYVTVCACRTEPKKAKYIFVYPSQF